VLKTVPECFSVSVTDEGNGPSQDADTQTAGIGARMVEAFAHKIDAMVTKGRDLAGYSVTVIVPRRADLAVDQT
jgi:two-component sensor histidine kinase